MANLIPELRLNFQLRLSILTIRTYYKSFKFFFSEFLLYFCQNEKLWKVCILFYWFIYFIQIPYSITKVKFIPMLLMFIVYPVIFSILVQFHNFLLSEGSCFLVVFFFFKKITVVFYSEYTQVLYSLTSSNWSIFRIYKQIVWISITVYTHDTVILD